MSDVVLEGLVSIEAAVESGNRPIHRLLTDENAHERVHSRLSRLGSSAGVPVERVSADVIAEHASGTTHGGAVALAGPREFQPIESLTTGVAIPFVVMLDGIEDPFNLGYALRSLYAAGVDGVVVRSRNWTWSEGIVVRSSAGASERVKMAVVDSAEQAAEFFASRGLTVAATGRERSRSIYRADLSGPLFLLIGGEKRGITRSFLERTELILSIPYGREFDASLPAGAAVSVIAFEVMRQRAE
jgi:23S rRNA (guanosine2251-2'-O)-methyltransferase